MGPTDDRTARYCYRVHGPSVLIEYVVEEGVGGNPANHVHSIIRDPGNDYGEDWLGKHYVEHHERRWSPARHRAASAELMKVLARACGHDRLIGSTRDLTTWTAIWRN